MPNRPSPSASRLDSRKAAQPAEARVAIDIAVCMLFLGNLAGMLPISTLLSVDHVARDRRQA